MGIGAVQSYSSQDYSTCLQRPCAPRPDFSKTTKQTAHQGSDRGGQPWGQRRNSRQKHTDKGKTASRNSKKAEKMPCFTTEKEGGALYLPTPVAKLPPARF